MTKELIQKFELGLPLTDQECRDLYKFFLGLEEDLELLGIEYRHTTYIVRLNRDTVRMFLLNRNLNLPE